MKAVETVRPSSRLLNDSCDFNDYVKIKLIENPETTCEYVNGMVMSAFREQDSLENPKVLVLT